MLSALLSYRLKPQLCRCPAPFTTAFYVFVVFPDSNRDIETIKFRVSSIELKTCRSPCNARFLLCRTTVHRHLSSELRSHYARRFSELVYVATALGLHCAKRLLPRSMACSDTMPDALFLKSWRQKNSCGPPGTRTQNLMIMSHLL